MQSEAHFPDQGRVALVAASSQGIGRAIAAELRQRGYDVVLTSRSADNLEVARRELLAIEAPGRVSFCVMDLNDRAQIVEGVASLGSEFPQIDTVVANSGGFGHRPLLDAAMSDWETALTNKFRSLFWLLGTVLPSMRARGWGAVLNVGSVYTKEPHHGYLLTNSVRLLATGYLKSLSDELGTSGIRVNQILCGYVETDRLRSHFEDVSNLRGITYNEAIRDTVERIPLRRFSRPEEVAKVAAFLLSDDASYVTGQSVVVDGGLIRTGL